MDDKVKGLAILTDTILNSKRHQDYKHVTDLADEYYDIFTGTGVKKHLRQLVGREDDKMFEQRCKIYQTTIPGTVHNLDQMFVKPLRSNRIYSSVEHTSNNARDEINDRIRNFWQGESESGVDAYLKNKWRYYEVYDPNTFICIEFSDFDPLTEKTYPFPVEYTSKQSINYSYSNGVLDWFIAMVDVKYRIDENDPKKTSNGNKYILYLDNWAIVLTQVDTKKQILTDEQKGLPIYEIKDEKDTVHSAYVIQEFEMKSGKVPVARVGHQSDPITTNRTCVSIIHPALNFFKKELKVGSEFDLTMSLHVFPQKLQYGRRCEGNRDKGIVCNNGKMPNGGTCPECNGSMVQPIHKSAQDIILIAPPKDGQPPLDLEKALVYKSPPIDLIKFQDEFLDKLTRKAISSVFAANTVLQGTIEKTATEMDYGYDSINDTLEPYGNKYSYMWLFIVGLIATYTDNKEGATLYHSFPKDAKLKSVTTLLSEAKTASESGLSQHAIDAINNDILEAMYSDDQDTLTKIKTKNKFAPFSGKSKEEIQALMMAGDIIPYYKTLYIYFDVVFDAIDNEMGDTFYLMSYENQKAEVSKRIDEIIKEADAIKAKPFSISIIDTAQA